MDIIILFCLYSRAGMSARTGDGTRGGQTRSGQSRVRGGSEPVGQRAVHVAVQQLAGDGGPEPRPVHGGRAAQHGRVHATHATGLRHAHVLGEQRIRQADRTVCVPSDRRR